MNLGGDRYRKLHLRDEKSKRWAKMRLEARPAPSTPAGSGAAVFREYLEDSAEDRIVWLKKSGVFAIVAHFFAFLLVIPAAMPEAVEIERTAATIVKRYTPPAPPAKAKKSKRKKSAAVVPIPDPTPDDPEPIEPEASDVDMGDFDDVFAIGEPVSAPGAGGLRGQAFRAGDGGILSPQVMRQVDPEYTPEATRKGIQGEVWIEAVVDVDGSVVEPRLLRGLPDDELNARAMEAIQRWVFRPGMKDGVPVPVIAVFTVTYRLH
jgi:protein TonB